MVQVTQILELARIKPIIALLALASHYVLHSDEWDNGFHIFLGIWTIAFGGLATAEYVYDPRIKTIGAVIQFIATTAAVYFGTLITSILLHRVFFHRLRRVRLVAGRIYLHRSLTTYRSQVLSLHVFPNSTASSLESSPTINISNGPRGFSNSTRPM